MGLGSWWEWGHCGQWLHDHRSIDGICNLCEELKQNYKKNYFKNYPINSPTYLVNILLDCEGGVALFEPQE